MVSLCQIYTSLLSSHHTPYPAPSNSEIVVLLGENGTGKTTLIRMLAKMLEPDDCTVMDDLPGLSVSYKPQKIAPKFPGTVRELLMKKIRDSFVHPQFQVRTSARAWF